MRELARVSRVSVRTLYKTFGGKNELIAEAVQDNFTSAILGDALADSGLKGHARLLKILQLCSDDIARVPDYYRVLIGVFVSESKQGTQGGLTDRINGQIIEQVRASLQQMQDTGELSDWVDAQITAERIASEAMIASIQWAAGALDADGYRGALTYGTCMLLLGACKGEAAQVLRAEAIKAQPLARMRPPPAAAADEQASGS